ncbi:MAG: protein kinase, partial [Algiphilus sp.]
MLKAGDIVGKYKILRALGAGGMADVYEAEDPSLGRHVALKVLPPEMTRNKQLIQRFEKEVRAAASLNHHGIVTVFEVGEHEGLHYYSMRLLTGGDLRDRIDAGLTEIEALAILRELADAFTHAHDRGFVHRDVKPENIIFDEQGYPVLTDFGIAKAVDSGTRVTATGVSVGTPRYISPEQARGRTVDNRADIYSLGVILYEMLTGKPPYDGEESLAVIFQHVTEPIPRLPEGQAHLQALIDALMAKAPEDRPESAAAVIRLIDEHLPRHSTQEFRSETGATQSNPLIQRMMTPSGLRASSNNKTQITGSKKAVESQPPPADEAAKDAQRAEARDAAEGAQREEDTRKEAERKQREEADRQQREEEARQAAERKQREDADRRLREELARMEAEREAAERMQREEVDRQQREVLERLEAVRLGGE